LLRKLAFFLTTALILLSIFKLLPIYVVTTKSMEPQITQYSLVITSRFLMPHESDIGVYLLKSGKVVIHRVVEETEDEYIFKGDANPAPDPPVSKERVLGKVLFVVPGVGLIVEVLRQPIFLSTLLILFFASTAKGFSFRDFSIYTMGVSLVAYDKGLPGIVLKTFKILFWDFPPIVMIVNVGLAYLLYRIGSHFPSKSAERILSVITLSLMSFVNTVIVLRWFTYEVLWRLMVIY